MLTMRALSRFLVYPGGSLGALVSWSQQRKSLRAALKKPPNPQQRGMELGHKQGICRMAVQVAHYSNRDDTTSLLNSPGLRFVRGM
jgi:hypothetical protein